MPTKGIQEEWLAFQKNLMPADLVFVHARHDRFGRFIQRRIGSYWNHVALVLASWNELPFGGPLIVGAIDSGIEIHRLKKYTDHFDAYDIGVMRFPGLTEQQRREIVATFILNNIDVPYDYSRIIGLFIKPLVNALLTQKQYYEFAKKFIHERNFICSTFVHKAFHLLHEKAGSGTESGDEYQKLRVEEMYTPKDVAVDPIFKWIFNERH